MTQQSVESSQSPALVSAPLKLTVVGIAGANGSRQALETLFRNLPEDSGMAFVVVVRMGRQQLTQLPAQIQQRTNMPVVTAADAIAFQPDHVYVVPAGVQARFADGQLHLQDSASQPQPTDDKLDKQSIVQGLLDTFYSSLADQYGADSVAILLSGTGTDGLAGLQQVQAAGGLIFVQDPDDAAHGALPRRAVSQVKQQQSQSSTKKTGTPMPEPVFGSAGDLARSLIQQRGALRFDSDRAVGASTEQFDQVYQEILAEINRQTGHDMGHYKISTLYRRIARRMQIAGIPGPSQYVSHLRSHADEAVALFRDSLVSVTSFFRDPDAYTMLEQDCVPQLFAEKKRSDYVRVWVAGCATGEEAYSVAIQLMEYASQLKEPPRFQVFATDLDEEAISFARQGLYPAAIAKDMTPDRFERFFTEEDGHYRINTEVREHLLFAVHDLLKDPPFSRLDLICCRNVLIYFNREAQEKVFAILHYALNSSGYLFLGTSESVDSATELFSVVDKHCHLYQRRDVVNATQRRLPTSTPTLQGRRTAEDTTKESEPPVRTVEEIYTAWSLRTHTPARLLINDNYDITHMFGEVSRFLHDRDGAISQNILERVRPELRLDLQTSLYPAFQKRERTISRLLNMQIDEVVHLVQLHMGPVNEPGFPDNLVEVVFVVQDSAPILSLSTTGDSEHVDLALMTRMEEELMRTRERMQAVVEEYEEFGQELKTSNEELQSINEELKSTTEELETSKEELQSMNEELVTLNGELNNKIDELNRANSDLMNFIASTDVGAVFLDQDLRISRFTPRATDLFNLIESDLRRPISHITHRIHHTALSDLAAHVRSTADHIEETVQSKDNHWYILRLFPYRTVENRIDGVVITFVDISDLKRAESEERQRRQQQVLAALSRQALAGNDLDALFQTTTEQVAQVLGMQLCKVLELQPDGESLLLRAGVGWDAGIVGAAVIPIESGSQAGYTLRTEGPTVVRDLQTETRFHGPSLLTDHGVRSGMSVTIDGPNGSWGVLGVHDREPRSFATYDVDFLQAVANTLAAAVTRRTFLSQLQFQANILAQINDAVIAVDNEQKITYLNAAAAQQYAIADPKVALGRPLSFLHTHFWLTAEEEQAAYKTLQQEGSWRGENVHVRHDGAAIQVESNVTVLTEQNEVVGLLATIRDISEQKAAEDALRRQEAFVRQIADNVPGLVGYLGANGRYQFVNATFEAWFERSLADIMDGPALGFGGNTEQSRLEGYRQRALAGETVTYEECFAYPDGVTRNIWARYQPDIDATGNVLGFYIFIMDISERKAAEEALRASEERYRYLFETMDEGFCVVEVLFDEAGTPTDYRFLEANPAFAQFTGLEQAIGRTAREVVPGLEDHWVEIYGNVALSGEPVRFEQGSEAMGRWFNVYAFPVGDPESARVAILFNNITDRKQMEDTLRISEATARRHLDELEAIYNSVPIGLCVMDQELRYVRINERLAEMNGVPAADHIGHTGRELLPDLADKTEEMLRHVLATGEAVIGVEVTGEIPSQPGVHHTWIESWLPLHNEAGEVTAINIVVEEITERKQMEEALRISEISARRHLNELETIYHSAPVGLCVLDRDFRWVRINQRLAEMNGYPVAEHLGRTIRELLPHIADDVEAILHQLIETGKPVRNVELIGETPAQPGVQRSWLESLFPIYDADGTVSGINVVAEEITERKEAEQALRESEELRRLALEGAQLGTWTIDLRSGAAFWDSRYREIFGIAPTEPASNEKRIALIHPEDRAKAEEALARAMHPNSDGVYHVEKRVVWPDGTVHWVVTEGQVHFADIEGVQQPVRLIGVAQDITERRENEEELRYQGYLLQTVQDAIVSTDLNFTIRSWNQGAERAYGWSAEEAIGRRVVDLLATEYLQEGITPDVLLQTLFTTGSWQGEVIHHHKNGSAVFVSSIVIVLRDDDGNPTGAVAVNRDITAQKEAEAILARYQLLSNQARDIILFMRLDGQIVEANMAAVEAYGYDRATLLQMTVYDLRDPHTRTQILEQMIQANQEAGGRGIRFETVHRRRDGSTFPVEVSAIGADVGNERMLVSVIRDISERQAAEAALAASEAKFATAFSLSPLILTITSLADGRLMEVNESFIRLTGYTRAEAIGRTPDELGLWVAPQGRSAGLARLAAGETVENVEALFRMKNGEIRTCLLGGTVVTINGQPCALTALTDITERKAAEAALQASETQLRLVTENISGLVSYVDKEERYRFANATYEQWFAQPREQIIGHTIRECIGDAVYKRVQPQLARVFAGERVRFESTLPYADGVTRTVMATYVPDVNTTGAVHGFYALVTDISDRKRAEERLRFLAEASTILGNSLDTMATLNNVAHTAVPGIADWCAIDLANEDGTLQPGIVAHVDPSKIRWAEELRARYPIDPNAPLGAPNVIRTGHSEFYPEITDEMLRSVANNEEELDLLRSVGYRSVMIVPLKTHGRVLGAITFVATESDHHFTTDDLTMAEELAQRAAAAIGNAQLYQTVQQREQDLSVSEERFRSAFEQAAVGMAHLDPEGNYLRVNDRLCEILGYTREELLQKSFMDITHPDDLEADLAQTQRQIAGEIVHHSMEKRYIRRDGSIFWANMTASVVRDEAGAPKYGIVVVEDISARKAAEAALRELNATLEERIAERTAELERSNQDLDQFAYVASHDLKAPLRGIDSLASWISEDAAGVLPNESKEHLAKLRARVQRMEQLLEDLLTYSRVGRRDGHVETVQTGPLIHDVAELVAGTNGFAILIADPMPTIRTPRTPLELVFRNLIGNAIKHHDQPDNGEIRISAQEIDGFVEFTVADNGPGIDPVHHARIFNMFQTLRPRDQVEGSGMGLAIVQRTIELRGGTIRVESSLGNGAAFIFTWPKESQ